MIRVHRAAAALLIAVGVAAGAHPAHAQTLPPSLLGEVLASSESILAVSGDVTVNYSCDPTVGGAFTLDYTASGTATGPYPGTYFETGVVTGQVTTVDDLDVFANGVVTSWQATFTIDSPVGDVTGTKRLLTQRAFSCFDGGFRGLPYDEENVNTAARVSYEAVIQTGAGAFKDSGQALDSVGGSKCTGEPGSTADACADLAFAYHAEHFDISDGVLPLRLGTTGKATGGGQLRSAADPLASVSFGFNVRGVERRLEGTCNVLDQQAGVHVKCLTVDSYAHVGNTATWTGTADVNGVIERYRITTQDNGEPNRGADTFFLDTATYDTGGPVTHGNVQIHH